MYVVLRDNIAQPLSWDAVSTVIFGRPVNLWTDLFHEIVLSQFDKISQLLYERVSLNSEIDALVTSLSANSDNSLGKKPNMDFLSEETSLNDHFWHLNTDLRSQVSELNQLRYHGKALGSKVAQLLGRFDHLLAAVMADAKALLVDSERSKGWPGLTEYPISSFSFSFSFCFSSFSFFFSFSLALSSSSFLPPSPSLFHLRLISSPSPSSPVGIESSSRVSSFERPKSRCPRSSIIWRLRFPRLIRAFLTPKTPIIHCMQLSS